MISYTQLIHRNRRPPVRWHNPISAKKYRRSLPLPPKVIHRPNGIPACSVNNFLQTPGELS
jgi:hypothetical protein